MVVVGCFCLLIIFYAVHDLNLILTETSRRIKSEDKIMSMRSKIKAKSGSEENETTQNQKCDPQKHFVFCKTHKTGGTYVYRILQHYVSKYHLKRAKMPSSDVGGYPERIRPELSFIVTQEDGMRHPKEGDEFVIINHFRFSRDSLNKMMPKNTRYVSIVREPWSNFQSSFHFFHTYCDMKPGNGLQACFIYPYFHIAKGRKITFEEYLKVVFDELNASIPWFFRSKNYQAFDLGLDPLLDNDTEIDKAIRQLGAEIDLMLITEYMDESLILLKDLLCLSWSDITYEPSTRDARVKNYQRMKLTSESPVMKRFNDFSKLDVQLYEYFNKTLWLKIEAYGKENMKRDVEKLRSLRKNNKPQASAGFIGFHAGFVVVWCCALAWSCVKCFIKEVDARKNLREALDRCERFQI